MSELYNNIMTPEAWMAIRFLLGCLAFITTICATGSMVFLTGGACCAIVEIGRASIEVIVERIKGDVKP